MLNKLCFSIVVMILSINPLFADEKQSSKDSESDIKYQKEQNKSTTQTRLYNFKQNKIVFVDDVFSLTKEQGAEYIPSFYPGADDLYNEFIKKGDSVVAAISKTTIQIKKEIDTKISNNKKQK